MISVKVKKAISVFTMALILSATTIGSVSAKSANPATTTSIKGGTMTPNLGGGPSPDATWSILSQHYVNFTHDQLATMDQKYVEIMSSDSYTRDNGIYTFGILAAGVIGAEVIGGEPLIYRLGMAYESWYFPTLVSTYMSRVRNSATTVRQAYFKGGTQALYVTEIYRPLDNATLVTLSWY